MVAITAKMSMSNRIMTALIITTVTEMETRHYTKVVLNFFQIQLSGGMRTKFNRGVFARNGHENARKVNLRDMK